MVKKQKTPGVSIPVGKEINFPNTRERETFMFLCEYYYTNINVLATSRQQGKKTPDIEMNGLLWELKSPKNNGKYTMEHCVKAAAKQSENIIIDLRRMPGSYRQYLSLLEREFQGNRRLKRMKIINKAQKILDFSK